MSAWETEGQSDEWYTPRYIFDALGCRFDLDVAAPEVGPQHVPCDGWLWTESLDQPWYGLIWMNPPYGKRGALAPWLEKFVKHNNGLALVPDRTSAPWFQRFAPLMDSVLFVAPKIKFERPDGTLGKSPGTGSALFALGGQAAQALRRCNLGWLAK